MTLYAGVSLNVPPGSRNMLKFFCMTAKLGRESSRISPITSQIQRSSDPFGALLR